MQMKAPCVLEFIKLLTGRKSLLREMFALQLFLLITYFCCRTKWALQEDRLYFNKKIYKYNQTTNQVSPISDIV